MQVHISARNRKKLNKEPQLHNPSKFTLKIKTNIKKLLVKSQVIANTLEIC